MRPIAQAIASWVGAIGRGISGDRTEKPVVGAIALKSQELILGSTEKK